MLITFSYLPQPALAPLVVLDVAVAAAAAGQVQAEILNRRLTRLPFRYPPVIPAKAGIQ